MSGLPDTTSGASVSEEANAPTAYVERMARRTALCTVPGSGRPGESVETLTEGRSANPPEGSRGDERCGSRSLKGGPQSARIRTTPPALARMGLQTYPLPADGQYLESTYPAPAIRRAGTPDRSGDPLPRGIEPHPRP